VRKDPRSIVRTALLSEKGTALVEAHRQYVFEVAPYANKPQIAHAVEELFSVKVIGVRTMRVRGKKKRLGMYRGRRPDWKKAVVTLKEGDAIQILEGA
jgi:large subunit ribosomal protein L23